MEPLNQLSASSTGEEKARLAEEEAKARLTEMVLDHLGIPRPGRGKLIQELEDKLLPEFMYTARNAWLAANPFPTSRNIILDLHNDLEEKQDQMENLNNILEELGVHDLLSDMAESADVSMLDRMPVDSYEVRLLKAVGHPNPEAAIRALLDRASKDPGLFHTSEKQLQQAVTLKVQGDINIFLHPTLPPDYTAPPSPSGEKPKRRKLFSGLGKLFSGCVLLTGNAVMIPTVTMGITALPVLTSLAGGIAAVAEGVSQLIREGE